jgi:hypothetical protein
VANGRRPTRCLSCFLEEQSLALGTKHSSSSRMRRWCQFLRDIPSRFIFVFLTILRFPFKAWNWYSKIYYSQGFTGTPEAEIQKHKAARDSDKSTPPTASLCGSPATPWDKREDYRQQLKEYGGYILKTFRFLDEHNGTVTALATVAIVGLTYATVHVSTKQWKVAQDTLRLSQRAYVTVGRKDGVIAEMIKPTSGSDDANIVIYFQNSGHSAAKLAWGMLGGTYLGGGSKGNSNFVFTHRYIGLRPRTRDKNGGMSQPGETSIIAGDSILVAALGTISQQHLSELPTNEITTLTLGQYAYCDNFGTQVTRSFGLRYRSHAASPSLSFDLALEVNLPNDPLPPPTDLLEYLPACDSDIQK